MKTGVLILLGVVLTAEGKFHVKIIVLRLLSIFVDVNPFTQMPLVFSALEGKFYVKIITFRYLL